MNGGAVSARRMTTVAAANPELRKTIRYSDVYASEMRTMRMSLKIRTV
jgi:hypothetical protein